MGVGIVFILKICVVVGYKVGVRVVVEGGEVLFCGFFIVGKIVYVGGFVLSVVILFLDIYILVINLKEIYVVWRGIFGNEFEKVKELWKFVDELEMEIFSGNNFVEVLDEFFLIVIF